MTQEHAHKLLASQETLCSSCHKGAILASHPSGFRPNRPLSGDFPLDWKGDLTCSTCHVIHGDPPGQVRLARREREFCHLCHTDEFFAQMRDQGQSLVSSGHLDARTRRFAEIDAYSLQCMGCHAEQASMDAVAVDPFGLMRHVRGSVNHPIGSDYAQAARAGGYRSIGSLAKNILLPDGKIGCVSCHEGYSRNHGKLLERGSNLCFLCHDL